MSRHPLSSGRTTPNQSPPAFTPHAREKPPMQGWGLVIEAVPANLKTGEL
jgi:hypothetical protein